MIVEPEQADEVRTLSVQLSPSLVDAGGDIALKGKVSTSPSKDLRGEAFLIRDQTGAEKARVQLTDFHATEDGEKGENETGRFILKAPDKAGEYTWSAVLLQGAEGDPGPAETSSTFSFYVRPHAMNVVVWDVPSAVVAGEKFAIKVGIKCSSQCLLEARTFTVFDHQGQALAEGKLRPEPWPGTAALYFSEVELEAPPSAGRHEWEVRIAEADDNLPHGTGSSRFGVVFVSPPQHNITVEAFDTVTHKPIKGAHILMHPYRAVTDENGVAKLRVAGGAYRIFISAPKYISAQTTAEVKSDLKTRADLTLEPVREKN